MYIFCEFAATWSTVVMSPLIESRPFFSRFHKLDSFVDLKLIGNDGHVFCHKMVAAANSSFIRDMLMSVGDSTYPVCQESIL
jgi:hypothetical protein